MGGGGGGRVPANSFSGGPDDILFCCHQSYFTEGHVVRNRLEKQSSCFFRGSISEFIRKPIATCDFPGVLDPLSLPSGSAHVCCFLTLVCSLIEQICMVISTRCTSFLSISVGSQS